MEELLSTLQSLLSRHIGLHRQLLDLVRLENEAIVQMNLKDIQEITFSKEAVINAIQNCEEQRKVVCGLLEVPALDNLILKLQDLGNSVLSEQFRTAYNTLRLLIEHISDQNDQNKGLVEHSLTQIQSMKKNILGVSDAQNTTYTAHGQSHFEASRPRLIEQEA
ncbi:MAG: flagellar protein FlgN [Xanthomonadaceae bacterium]|nr:flagellar protein FlgN [Xanthomonadaceae bacterium]